MARTVRGGRVGSRAGPEQSGADPHHRGALLHGDLEVGARPIEHVDKPRRSTSARSQRKPGRASSGVPAGATPMRPATTRPSPASASVRGAASSLVQPPFWGSPLRFTCTRPRHRGPPGDLRPQGLTVDALPKRHVRSEGPHLVALEVAEEVPAGRGPGRGDGVDLGDQLLGVVLPEI